MMTPEQLTLLGSIAAFLTTVSFIPQVIKTLKTRDTEGISLLMYSLFVVGISLWLAYGLLRSDFPVIVGNLITFILASIVLGMKVINTLSGADKRREREN